MWKPYLQVIAEKVPQALNILDRYHIVAKLSKALDNVRAAEAKELKRKGYEDLLMNWFKAKKEYSCGAVEGLNRKVNLITRKSYGFRSLKVLTTALYHAMGQLPEPHLTHSF
jgi:transposase